MKKGILFVLIMIMCSGYHIMNAEQEPQQIISTFITSLQLPYLSQDQINTMTQSIVRYAQENALDPLLVMTLIYRESLFNPQAVSSVGALGLGQIKPMNFPNLGITDPFDIEQNTRGTARYLKQMLSLWKSNPNQLECALGSYFKGYTGFKRDGGITNAQTDNYIKRIVNKYHEFKQL